MSGTLAISSIILVFLTLLIGLFKLLREKRKHQEGETGAFNAAAYCNSLYRDWYTSTNKGPKKKLVGESYERMIWRMVREHIVAEYSTHRAFEEMLAYVDEQIIAYDAD